jgi:DNA-binding transcriptional LysR family regulator
MEIDQAMAWDDLRVLLAVHRAGSFLSAGRALGMSTSTTARRIGALEQAVGRRLVVKTSSGTHLESAAVELVELAESVEAGLRETKRKAETLAGVVRISVGEGFAVPLLPALAALRRRSPELTIEVMAENRVVDLARREADLGVRKTRSNSAVLMEKPLGRVRFGLYGARSYLERRAVSRDELSRHDFVGFLEPMLGLPQAKWLSTLGAKRIGFRANNDAVLLEAVREGQGLGVLPELIADADPTLQKIQVEAAPPELPVWLAWHRELRNVPRVRAVADTIIAAFRARLPR